MKAIELTAAHLGGTIEGTDYLGHRYTGAIVSIELHEGLRHRVILRIRSQPHEFTREVYVNRNAEVTVTP